MAKRMFSQPLPNTSSIRAQQRRRPRRHADAAGTMRADQHGDAEVRDHRREQERPVRAGAEDGVDAARKTMTGTVIQWPSWATNNHVVDAAGLVQPLAGEEERPVVADEPLVAAGDVEHDAEQAESASAERPARAVVGRYAQATALARARTLSRSPRTTIRHHRASSCRALRTIAGRRKNCDLPDGRK